MFQARRSWVTPSCCWPSAPTPSFLAAYLHGARQQVTGHNLLLDLAAKVETAHRRVLEFDQDGRSKPRLAATYFEYAAADLEDARRAVDRFLADEPGHPRRQEFEEHARRLAELERDTRQTQQALIPYFEERPKELDDRFPQLRNELDIFKDQLQRELRGVASDMREQWKNAVQMGIILGGAGLLAAIGAALWLWRTLRPLQELRLKARRIASGDYGKRIGIYSRDEIGDLAREFDGMAWALQEREQRLIRSERLATVGKVAAQITHEIRNPLASIGLNAELLVDELGPAQNEGRRLLEVISGEIDRLSEITESYLRYVRLPRPKLEPEDPAALVSAVMEFARAELALAGITLELDAPAGLPEIAADENQLRQALLNLVRNAREAMPDGGRLQVAVAAGRRPGEAAGGGHRRGHRPPAHRRGSSSRSSRPRTRAPAWAWRWSSTSSPNTAAHRGAQRRPAGDGVRARLPRVAAADGRRAHPRPRRRRKSRRPPRVPPPGRWRSPTARASSLTGGAPALARWLAARRGSPSFS